MPTLRKLCQDLKITPNPTGEKKTITEPFRSSYAFVHKARAMNETSEPKFSIQAIFDKKDVKALRPLVQIAANAAAAKFGADMSKWPKMKYDPMTLDTEMDEGNLENLEKHYIGAITVNFSNEEKPGIVGPNAKPIMSENEFYSGCYARASVAAFGYDNSGNKGVSFSLRNLMKVKDSDRLDGRANPEVEFAGYASDDDGEDEAKATTSADTASAETGF